VISAPDSGQQPDLRVPGYLGRVLDDEGNPAGTCFQVAPRVLVTAWHVLDDIGVADSDATVWVDPLAGGESFAAAVARLDPVHDLAVLAGEASLPAATGQLAATDQMPLRERVRVTGHAVPDDPGHNYRFLDAPGRWAGGTTRDDAVPLGRMTSDAVVRGMSGAPVIRDSDGLVAGVVSGRYNSADGWLVGTVWVSRTEDLAKLLDGIVDVTTRQAPLAEQFSHGQQLRDSSRFQQTQDRLMRPMAGFLGARPTMPARFIPRPHELERLLAALGDEEGRAVALVGMGGAGKTVLATKAVQEPSIHRQFEDGVAWLAVGQQPDIVELQSRLARRLGEPHPQFTTKEAGRDLLASLLYGRNVLLVLDNVWDRAVLDAFIGLASGCVVLFTARYSQLARDLDAIRLEITQLTLEQALALLARWINSPVDALPPVADLVCLRVDNLALGVAMVGAMLAQPGRTWQDLLQLLDSTDLAQIKADFGEEYPHPNLLAAIQLSIDDLPDEPTRQRYRELAVFKGQGAFPRSAVEALWAPTGLTGPAVGEVLATLAGRSLLSDEGDGWFGIHDLQLDVISKQLGAARLQEAHQHLLVSYNNRCPVGWPTGPNDGYFFEHLAFHLAMADQRLELSQLLTDLEWMLVKLTTTGLAGLLADYTYDHDTPTSQAVQVALQLSAGTAVANPDQLPGQLVGRLISHPDPAVQAVADAVGGWTEAPWLCPLTQPGLAPAAGPQRNVLLGHTGQVQAVAVTPDNRLIISASTDRTIRIWELASGRLVRTLEGHSGYVSSVAVTADSQLMISGGWDNTVRVWNLASGRLVRTLEGHSAMVDAVTVSPDNRRIASGSKDATLRIWDLASGRPIHILEGHSDQVTAVAASPDSQKIISASWDNTVRVWDVASGQLLQILHGDGDSVYAVAACPDNLRIVSGSKDGIVRVWDVASGQLVRTLEGHGHSVRAVAVSRDNQIVVSGSSDRTVRVWNLATGQLVRTLQGHGGSVDAMAISPDNQLIVTGNGATVLVFYLTFKAIPAPKGHTEPVMAVAISPDNQLIISGGMDAGVRTWDLASGQLIRTFEGHTKAVDTVAVTPDNRLIISGSRDTTIRAWDLASGQLIRTFEGHTKAVEAVAVTPDNRLIISASLDGTMRVWRLASGRLIRSFEGHGGPFYAVAVSPDNRFIIACDKGGSPRVWNLASGQLIRTLEGPSGIGGDVAFSPDNLLIAMGRNSIVQVWNLATGQLVRTLEGHNRGVDSVAFAPDNKTIVSGAHDRTVRVWNLTDGRELSRWTSDYMVFACAIAPSRPLTIAVGDQSGIPYVLQLRGVNVC
jgi:WD40 repeat protein